MIPIKISNRENVLKEHWIGLSALVLRHETEINSWIVQNDLSDILGSEPIKNLICGDFKLLQLIVQHVGSTEELSFLKTNYETFANRDSHLYHPAKLVSNVGINVCPYCNRSFIHSVNSRTRTCQLDHFYSKDEHPYLALSFFNLVPCCYACNHQKSTASIDISPYQDFRTDELLTFKYRPKDSSFKYPKGEIEIQIELHTKDGLSLESNINVFGLKELYTYHDDAVKEILLKGEIYSHDYIQSLLSQFPDLIESEEEAIRLVTGNYVLEEDLGKRPLAKLTRDISIETKLIKN